jgi:NAD(P)-dependent dehydrogenase (short-subunit alcohol dehydrogenase family)
MSHRPVALVTGAARRVGRTIALDLAHHGFDVAVHFHSSAPEAQEVVDAARAAGAQAQAFQADLSQESAARQLTLDVAQYFGHLDAVVNNASAFSYDDLQTFSYRTLHEQMATNAAAAVVLAQGLHQLRKSSGTPSPTAACVVNLLDQKLWNPNPDYFSYTLSKAALESATTMLAQALAPWVRVCGVAPGVTLLSGDMSPEEFDRAHRMTPLQRSSTPQDIAQSVRFLLQSPAITGTTLLVDGGQHLQGQSRDVMFLARSPH